MISIELEDDRVYVHGHAGQGRFGSDIVCAGISALSETLRFSLEELTDDIIDVADDDGLMDIKFETLSLAGGLLVESFVIGATAIANTYPDNVQVRDDRSRRVTINTV